MSIVNTIVPEETRRMHVAAFDSMDLQSVHVAALQSARPRFWKDHAQAERYSAHRLTNTTISSVYFQQRYVRALSSGEADCALVNWQHAWQAIHFPTQWFSENGAAPRDTRRCQCFNTCASTCALNLDSDEAEATRAFARAIKASRVVEKAIWLECKSTIRVDRLRPINHRARSSRA